MELNFSRILALCLVHIEVGRSHTLKLHTEKHIGAVLYCPTLFKGLHTYLGEVILTVERGYSENGYAFISCELFQYLYGVIGVLLIGHFWVMWCEDL